MTPSPSDERAHDPGPELAWSETWTFDFASADGALAGWASVTRLPNRGAGWYHAFLAGTHRQLIAVIDTEVPMPDASLEIRTEGLWATHVCETPHDHWTIGLEAFGVGVDDPAELYGRQFGDRVPLGFDLEWEAAGAIDETSDPAVDYQQPCRVTGEVLVGAEELDLDGHGWRERRWGVAGSWDHRWFRAHGRLGDETTWSVAVVDGDLGGAGATVDGAAVEVVEASQTMSGPGMPGGAGARLGDLAVELSPAALTPLELVDVEGRRTRAPRALCRTRAGDGRAGWAWAEWNEPRT